MTMTDVVDASRPIPDADKFRLLHTMIRVRDLDASLNFYANMLGMKLLRKRDYPTGKFTLAFVGYGDESNNTVIELTHNWGQAEPYDLGSAFGHLAVGVPDVYKTCERLAAAGVKIPRPAGPMAHGGSVIAFIEDPTDIGSSWSNARKFWHPPALPACRRRRGGRIGVSPAVLPARNGAKRNP